MKIAFILPRYHTNLVHSIDDLISAGHEVTIYVQHMGKLEYHENVKPIKIKESLIWKITERILSIKGENYTEKKRIHWYIPNIAFLWKELKTNKPDVLILRERNVTTMIATIIAKALKIKKIILYNQTPIYSRKPNSLRAKIKKKIKSLIFSAFFPKIRITPVEFSNYDDYVEYTNNPENFEKDQTAKFVPLVIKPNEKAKTREYCPNGILRILDVGKYRDYKNHFIIVDAIEILYNQHNVKNIQITIAGQMTNQEEKEYYERLKKHIQDKKLDHIITLKTNIPYQKMEELYLTHDILILASKREIFGFVVLEAMAHGMLVISTNNNGSATYIQDKKTGYIFQNNDPKSLANVLSELAESKEKLQQIAQISYRQITNYSLGNYSKNIEKLTKNSKKNILLITKLWTGAEQFFLEGRDEFSGLPPFETLMRKLLILDEIDEIHILLFIPIKKSNKYKKTIHIPEKYIEKIKVYPVYYKNKFESITKAFLQIPKIIKKTRTESIKFTYGIGRYGALSGLLTVFCGIPNARTIYGTFLSERINKNKCLIFLRAPLDYLTFTLPAEALFVLNDGTRGDDVFKKLNSKNQRIKKFVFKLAGVPRDIQSITKPIDEETYRKIPENYISYIGRIDNWKGQIRFIETLENLRNKGLYVYGVIVGQISDESYYKKMLDTINKYNLWDRILLIKGLSHEQTLTILKNSTLSCFFYDVSNLSIAFLESLKLGVPTIAINVKNSLKVIPKGTYHELSEEALNNIEQRAMAIELILTDHQYRTQLSQKALEFGNKLQTWDEYIEDEIEIIRKNL